MNFYDVLILISFVVGYFFITIEHTTKINKTGIAILMAVFVWVFQFAKFPLPNVANTAALAEHIGRVSEIVIFLLGALIIVETISAYKGFKLISDHIHIHNKRKLLWIIGFLTFFLSSVLDNLTTTIIMIALLNKIVPITIDRLLIGGAVVVAANAGGAWTPIGDVTTTMLWIGGQVSTLAIMKSLFIPSLVCMVTSVALISLGLKGHFHQLSSEKEVEVIEPHGKLIFFVGLSTLILVPIFKLYAGLPPFMGILFGVAVLWLLTDILNKEQHGHQNLRFVNILSRVDLPSVLFFLGILLCIDGLHTARLLDHAALWLDSVVGNPSAIAATIGLLSAIVDNVPLVAAVMGMYSIDQFAIDSSFWGLVALCAGTGGSILVIGSAAGVAYMGLEHVRFFWYFRHVGIPALFGYFAGIAAYMLF